MHFISFDTVRYSVFVMNIYVKYNLYILSFEKISIVFYFYF